MKTIGILAAALFLMNVNCIGQSKYTQVTEGNTITTENTKFDPNYKHQAGKTNVESSNSVIKEEYTEVSDRNYKHQAGSRKNRKENVLTVKSERGMKRDNNYKHQFPSR